MRKNHDMSTGQDNAFCFDYSAKQSALLHFQMS